MGFCRGWALDKLDKNESARLQEALSLMAKMLILVDIAIRSQADRGRNKKDSSLPLEALPAPSDASSQEINIQDIFAALCSDREERFLYITFHATEKVYNANPETDDANNIIHLSYEEIVSFCTAPAHFVKSITFGEGEEFDIGDNSPAGQRYIKTNHLPYDRLITACLTILYRYLPDKLHLRSDYDGAEDYTPGVHLASLLLNERFKNPCDPNEETNFVLPYPVIAKPSSSDTKSFIDSLINFTVAMIKNLTRFSCWSENEEKNALEALELFPIGDTRLCEQIEFARNVANKLKELKLITWELQFVPKPNYFIERSLHAIIQLPRIIASLLKELRIAPLDLIQFAKAERLHYLFVRLINYQVEWLTENGFLSSEEIHLMDRPQFDDAWIAQHQQFLKSTKEALQTCLSTFRKEELTTALPTLPADCSFSDSRDAFVSHLLTGQTENLGDELQLLYQYSIQDAASHFDKPDEFYRGFMVGLIASSTTPGKIKLQSSEETGRCNLVIIPQIPDDPQYNIGIILELTHTADPKTLNCPTKEDLLQQTKESKDLAYLKFHGIKNIVAIHIVFHDRKVFSVSAWLERTPQLESTAALITHRRGSDSPLSAGPPSKKQRFLEPSRPGCE